MSVDRGMAEVMSRFRVEAGRDGASFDNDLTIQVGRLADAMERDQRREQALAQAVAPVPVGPIDFTVTGGQPKFKTARAAAADASPQEGYFWFVTRLTLAGLNAGDLVNLHVTPSQGSVYGNVTARHTFTPTGTVAAGLGVADWEPGTLGLILWPDDSFLLQSAGTLAASELILSGNAIQVHGAYLAEYLL